MITAYFKFESLADEVRAKHGIKAKGRLDCLAYTNLTGYTGLTDFINAKRQMYLYKIPAKEFVKSNSKRLAEWALSNGKLNLSSIYFEDIDYPEYGYGYPNANRLLSNGQPNPLFPYRNDCYLFITNQDLTTVEILVITNGRNLAGAYYQRLIDGELESELEQLRAQAKPFFDYWSSL
ncbi:hypothetical protein [Pontibacter pudoricolor]|uniref:hypothetical protein n=1 Tax=Pontibacter pudoricolor TaxID=2694930 RepID=UPI001390F25B|nr:hypothetical protein [Pontibacter pudoricolor]